MRLPHPRHLPLSRTKLRSGMFWTAEMRCPHAGHCDRGTSKLYRSVCDVGLPASSAHCCRQVRSSMIGSRWMTTLRKLPTAKPSRNTNKINVKGLVAKYCASDIMGNRGLLLSIVRDARRLECRGHLKDRQ